MAKKKKELTQEMLIDLWLSRYHNTTLNEVIKEHPEWMDEPQKHSKDFYNTYAVTQEQHDEWYDDAKKIVKDYYNLSKKEVNKQFMWIYLNVAPTVKGVEDES